MPNVRGFDPFGSMQGFVNQFRSFMGNPTQMVMQRMGIPQNMANDPNQAIQWLMDNGRLSQSQYNQARQMADRIQNSGQFQQFMGGSPNK